MRRRRAYDHAAKAGNPADVWKHFCLLTVLDGLLAARDPNRPFHYRESHAGAGEFVLGEDGEWRRGIGAALPAPAALAEHPYFRALGDGVGPGTVFPGSWSLVASRLAERGAAHRIELFDTSTAVSNAIWARIERRRLPPTVEFQQLDGFAAVAGGPADLTLIDPPYHPARADWRRVRKAARLLHRRGDGHLIWYPVDRPSEPDRLVDAAGAPGFEVRWTPPAGAPEGALEGCGVVAGGAAGGLLEAARAELDAVAARLGGRASVRGAA